MQEHAGDERCVRDTKWGRRADVDAAGVTHIVANADSVFPSIGASGAIAGVLAAYLRLFPHAQVRTLLLIGPFILVPRIAATFLIIFWFITQFISGITSLGAATDTSGGVAVWAHVGGFIAGLILVVIMRPRAATPPRYAY